MDDVDEANTENALLLEFGEISHLGRAGTFVGGRLEEESRSMLSWTFGVGGATAVCATLCSVATTWSTAALCW